MSHSKPPTVNAPKSRTRQEWERNTLEPAQKAVGVRDFDFSTVSSLFASGCWRSPYYPTRPCAGSSA